MKDIYELLNALERTDDANTWDYEEENLRKFLKSEVFMTSKYTAGSSNPQTIVNFNNYINKYALSLGNEHLELFYKLVSSVRKYSEPARMRWIYRKAK